MFLFRRAPNPSSPNPAAWMISYADMVTILLAMFIVLSTLAKDQTGMSLYQGTGSYRQAVHSLGLPGGSSRTAKPVELTTPGQQFRPEDRGQQPPEAEPPSRVIDVEEELFQEYLRGLREQAEVARRPAETGRAFVDFHSRPRATAPYLTARQREMIEPLAALARRPGYQVEVVAWAPTPADTAVARSLTLAQGLQEEILQWLQLPPDERGRVGAISQPWAFRDVRRPVFSIAVIRRP